VIGAVRRLAARLRPARVPGDGAPLDDGELRALIGLIDGYADRAGTRALAVPERAAEERARQGWGRA
jgi:hypothetical protein